MPRAFFGSAMLVLRTLGGLSLDSSQGLAVGAATQRRRLAILAVIAAAGKNGASRDRLLALFWPESDAELARGSLKQAVFALRRDSGEPDLVLGTTELRLNPAVVHCDVEAFTEAIEANDFEGAVALYTGPFLDGVFLREAPDFEQWADDERARLTRAYRSALEQVGRAAESRRDWLSAAEARRQLAATDPMSARLARGYMEALVAAGDREAAIQHGECHSALVRRELEAEPDADVVAFVARLRATPPLTPPSTATSAASTALPPFLPTAVPPEFVSVQAPEHAPESLGAVPAPRHGSTPARRAMLVVVLLAVTGVAWVLFATLRAPTAAPVPASMIVVSLDEAPGDSLTSRFERDATSAITNGLTESGLVRVVDARGGGLFTRERAVGHATGQSAARELAQQSGARYAMLGTFSRDGATLTGSARLIDVASGAVLRVVPPVRASLDATAPAVAELRARAMGAAATALDPRMASLTGAWTPAPTWQAYRLFMDGLDEFTATHYQKALSAFTQAYQSDTAFVTPLIWSAHALGNLGRDLARDSLIAWMEARRSRFPVVERLGLDYFIARGLNDQAARLEALRRAAAAAPGSQWSYLLASELHFIGGFEEARAALVRVDPLHGWARDWVPYWRTAFGVYGTLKQLDEHLVRIREARAAYPHLDVLAFQEVQALFILERTAEMQSRLTEFLAVDWGASIWGPAMLLPTLSGMATDAASRRTLAEQCVRWYQEHGEAATLPFEYKAQRFGGCLYDAHRWQEAETVVKALVDTLERRGPPRTLVERANRIFTYGLLGRIAAYRGNRAEAERIMTLLPTLPEPRPDVHRGEYSIHLALIAAVLGDRERAMEYGLRARMCCSDKRPSASLDTPEIARYLRDSVFLAAFGIVNPDRMLPGDSGRRR